MSITRFRLPALCAGVVALVAGTCASAAEPGKNCSVDLSAATFSELHSLIRPQPDEWRHLKVHWMTDIVPARKKAAAEDKPIVILYTGGAGYNEPLGVC